MAGKRKAATAKKVEYKLSLASACLNAYCCAESYNSNVCTQGSGEKKRARDPPSVSEAEPSTNNLHAEPSALQNNIHSEKTTSHSTVKQVSLHLKLDLYSALCTGLFSLVAIFTCRTRLQRDGRQSLLEHLCPQFPLSIARWQVKLWLLSALSAELSALKPIYRIYTGKSHCNETHSIRSLHWQEMNGIHSLWQWLLCLCLLLQAFLLNKLPYVWQLDVYGVVATVLKICELRRLEESTCAGKVTVGN